MQPDWEHEYVEFVTTAMPRMRRLAYLLCGDAHRADDLVQQTFTTLYVHWPRVRTVTHLDGYVRAETPAVLAGERPVLLPLPDGAVPGRAGPAAVSVSDDGRVVGGLVSVGPDDATAAVRWTCE
ncbi:sigma factor [Plantactinospora sp. KLBMP9567]|uniref:sigma factor n=1 Tax=Plantactinospora sp. KLBMP9567 TaxID=3085900 RepID=UPI0029827A86|nr:sigma factor [Plantactinospora sp. KLBMP9567]MDW5326473.1 sigma factor [Plantactinospora sp. KLBMP9567]